MHAHIRSNIVHVTLKRNIYTFIHSVLPRQSFDNDIQLADNPPVFFDSFITVIIIIIATSSGLQLLET